MPLTKSVMTSVLGGTLNANVSAPAPPVSESLPPRPSMVSLPSAPISRLFSALPVMMLSIALPAPLIAAVPTSVRLLTKSDSV